MIATLRVELLGGELLATFVVTTPGATRMSWRVVENPVRFPRFIMPAEENVGSTM
jgi:hypothetical protein